jgi:hypothetical protein
MKNNHLKITANYQRRFRNLRWPVQAIGCAAALLLCAGSRADTINWLGTSGTDTNWSNGNNWTNATLGSIGTAPGGADAVRFLEAGTNGTVGLPNSYVDSTFPGYIGSLQFGQSAGLHTVVIASGQTLNITNGNLVVGTPNDIGVTTALNLTNSIKGAGGTLTINSNAAVIALNQGTASGGNSMRANLDLSGLDMFVANVSRLGIGSTVFPNPGSANQREAGQLILAKTNIINLSYTDTLANYQTANKNNALEMSRNPGNNAGIPSILLLGISNSINLDSLGIGRDKSTGVSGGWISFNPAFLGSSPSAVFRGVGGGNNRIKWWALGDMNANASSAQVATGTNDFTGGTVDAMVDVLSLSRDCSPSHTAAGRAMIGTFTFNAGIVDVNTLYVGNQAIGPIGSSTPMQGFLNVNGAATLRVNNVLMLANTTVASVASTNTFGILRINGGTVLANSIAVGNFSTVTNTIAMNSATLVVTNTLATNASGLFLMTMTNSVLQLRVPGDASVVALVKTLTTSGANTIALNPTPVVFSSYPKQIPLIKYTTLNGAGYNFSLASVPEWAPGAYLSNNVANPANPSVDLYIPYNPAPVITTQPSSYSGSPGDNASFTVSVDANSVTPLSYQWYHETTALSDGATGNGSTLSGTATATLAINSAQPADNGNYTVVISNIYGAATSAPPAVLTISAGNIAPSITGPTNTTVIESNNVVFTASVAGNPAPTVRWQRDGQDIQGATTTTLVVTNVQYPEDNNAVFSIIADNIAGSATNSATLTVIVPPTISQQPQNLAVTNTQTASFSVVASGVPAPTYQWYKNSLGNPITDATNTSFTIASTSPTDTATYFVVVVNAAGSIQSSNATLTVNSLGLVTTALSPTNGTTGVCYDTPLAITFSQTPVLRSAGTIKIYNINSATPVDTINLSLNTGPGVQAHSPFPGDTQPFNYYPVIISGTTATIYPHGGVMTSNQTYYVTVDNGVFADTAGAYFVGITDTNVWKFTTKPGGPINSDSPIVNADGSGDFVTVQGAVDSLSTSGASRRTIKIRNGSYFEIVDISGKPNVTFLGESRNGAVIKYPNNAAIAPGGTTHARMTFKINASDVALDNLTVSNSTPQGGSQAEAVMIETSARRCIINNCEIDSRQDTILANVNSSQGYFKDTKIVGNFDYIWGGGNLYFDNCWMHTIIGAAGFNLTAARTDTSGVLSTNTPWLNPNGTTYSADGFSFVGCTFTADSGVANITLAGNNGTAGGVASWALCKFDTSAYITPTTTISNSYVLWQYSNTDLSSNPISFANVQTIGITNDDPRLLAATNPIVWLYGWTPQLAPNITSQPTDQTVNANQNASFTVTATGIPNATYQWLKNGTNLTGQTSATLTINNASGFNIGAYSVVVANASGSVTSSVANLNVIAPTASPTLDTTAVLNNGNIQFTITGAPGSAGFGYRVWATTNISLTPITSTWTLLTNDTFGTTPTVFTDSTASGLPQRYYSITVP